MGLRTAKQISRGECALWAVSLLAVLASIFILPEFVPLTPSISSSYVFGYNNRAGVVLLFVFLLLVGLLTRRLRLSFAAPAPSPAVSRAALLFWMGVFALVCLLMWFLCRGLHGFVEGVYFFDRLTLMLSGQRPYRDFEYAYGVLFLWLPLTLIRLGLTLETSYFLSWTLVSIAGVWLLAQVLNGLDAPSPRKTRLFHLFCLNSVLPLLCTGLNYSLARFLLAAWFGLIVQRQETHHRSRAMLLSVLFTAILLGVSPEVAVSYAFGSMVYFAVFGALSGGPSSPWKTPAFPLLVVAQIALFALANHLQVFETLKAFRTGAFNFPIVPAVHILFFFACCALSAVFVASRLHRGAPGDSTSMVLAVSTLSLFAALGRCDPGHVFLNGLAIILVAAVLASSMTRTWPVFQWTFFLLIFFIPSAVSLWSAQGELLRLVFIRVFSFETPGHPSRLDRFIERGMIHQLGPEQGAAKLALYRTLAHLPDTIDVRPALGVPNETLQAPFGFVRVEYGTSRAEFGYYLGLINAFTPESVDRKIAEFQAHPTRKLLLPSDFESRCIIFGSADRFIISKLFLYPYHGVQKNEDEVWKPLCSYLDAHYAMQQAPRPDTFDFGLWIPR